jgi:hypothetical protein
MLLAGSYGEACDLLEQAKSIRERIGHPSARWPWSSQNPLESATSCSSSLGSSSPRAKLPRPQRLTGVIPIRMKATELLGYVASR